jgi:hypothetical protein
MGMMKYLFALFLLLWSASAEAARGFDTQGTGVTDVVATNFTVTMPAIFTIYSRIWITSAGGSTVGRVFANSTAGEPYISMNNTTTMNFQAGFSTTAGTWAWTAPSTGAWHTLILTYDGTSVSHRPLVFLDGVTNIPTTSTAPVGTYNLASGTITIGNVAAQNRVWDGKEADFAICSGIASIGQMDSYIRRGNPTNICGSNLLIYCPLNGFQTNELCWGPSAGYTGTVTGALYKNGPGTLSALNGGFQ